MPTVSKQRVIKRPRKKKSDGVINRIAPVKLDDKGIKINVYGRSGTGKTTFACTFPKPLLLIGTEDGTRSVHNVAGVDFVRIRNTEEYAELIQYASTSKYKTVTLDQASGLQDIGLMEILELDKLPVQRSWGMASRGEWGQCAVQTKERLRALLDLSLRGIHVVIIAQERSFNSEDEGELLMPFVASALTPSVVGWLNPACDYICQTFIRQKTISKKVKVGKKEATEITTKTKGVDYCLRTAPDEVYTTKFRLPKGTKLPAAIVDADFAKVSRLIKG